MSAIALRAYAATDLEPVLRCFARSVHQIATRYYTVEQAAAWAPAHLDREVWAGKLRSGCTLIADLDGAVAGVGRVEASGYIDLLYVDPQFERRGVGRLLLEAMCEWAGREGAARLTSDVSLAARPLFDIIGFVVEREQTVERRGVALTNFRMSRAPGILGR